ncbi:MAG TPA: hypothetical protein VHD33_03300, partial [Legionellaceae bacterium]|nr:hypothetical protein [Legionellaceae bacterium]
MNQSTEINKTPSAQATNLTEILKNAQIEDAIKQKRLHTAVRYLGCAVNAASLGERTFDIAINQVRINALETWYHLETSN